MPFRLDIDADLASELDSFPIGDHSWIGFLIGRRARGEVLGQIVLLGKPLDGPRLAASFVRATGWVREHLANLAPDLDLLGVVRYSPNPPMRWEREQLAEACRSQLGGVLLWVSPYGHRSRGIGREWSLFDLQSLSTIDIRRDYGLAGRLARESLARVRDALFTNLDAIGRGTPGWPARALRCVMTPGLQEQLEIFARTAYRGEAGGILLGKRAEGTTRLAAAVFPPQAHTSAVLCEFETRSLTQVCESLEELQRQQPGSANLQPVGWVHTHPRLSVFLSVTDVRTFKQWVALDPRALALVVDPHAAPGERLLACNGDMVPVVVEAHTDADVPRIPDAGIKPFARSLAGHGGEGDWYLVTGSECRRESPARSGGWRLWGESTPASPAPSLRSPPPDVPTVRGAEKELPGGSTSRKVEETPRPQRTVTLDPFVPTVAPKLLDNWAIVRQRPGMTGTDLWLAIGVTGREIRHQPPHVLALVWARELSTGKLEASSAKELHLLLNDINDRLGRETIDTRCLRVQAVVADEVEGPERPGMPVEVVDLSRTVWGNDVTGRFWRIRGQEPHLTDGTADLPVIEPEVLDQAFQEKFRLALRESLQKAVFSENRCLLCDGVGIALWGGLGGP